MNLRLVSLFLLAISLSCLAKPKTVKKPWFDVSSSPQFAIESVVLSDTATILHCAYHGRKGHRFSISPNSFITAGGKKMQLKGADGITPGKKTRIDSTLRHRHKLVFPPLPPKTKVFDFIEGYESGAFRIWGVRADGKKSPMPKADIRQAHADCPEELPMPQWKLGSTTVSGRILGYRPGMDMEITVYPHNAFDRNSTEVSAKPADDGSFSLSVPMHTTCQTVMMQIGPWYGQAVLCQDEGCQVYINLVEESHRYAPDEYSRLRGKSMSPDLTRPQFAGAMADVNNILATPEARAITWNSYSNNKVNSVDKDHLLPAREHAERVAAWTENNIRKADSLCSNGRARQVLHALIKSDMTSDLIYNNRFVQRDSTGRKQFDHITFELYRKAKLNSMLMAYSGNFKGVANRFEYICYDCPDFINSLKATARPLAMAGAPQDSINIAVERRQKEYRDSVFGHTDGPLDDMIYAAHLSMILDKDTPLSPKETAVLKAYPNKALAEHFLKDNDKLVAELAGRAKSGGYTLHSVPDTIGGMKFVESLSAQFPGKKIMVDFWGTWCGPCRHAIKEFEPKKKELANSGVVFVYVTDSKSPENEWRNMASGIKGHHYRLAEAQTREIYRNFKFGGWPSYLIIDTDGKYIYQKTGYREKAMTDKLKQ